jgi:glycine/D-amino acid oxidase-like deaminating enzyme
MVNDMGDDANVVIIGAGPAGVAAGRVREVVTDHGTIGCDWVVNAAGIGAAEVGRMVGVEVPIVPCRGQVVTTEPLPGLINQPLGSLKPNRAGPILIGAVYEFAGLDPTTRLETLAEKIARAIRIVPALSTAKMIRCWSGFRPWAIDGLPILGATDAVTGFLIATGHSGFSLGQITGKLITELVMTGETSIPIDNFSVDRFLEGRYAFPLEAFRASQMAEV